MYSIKSQETPPKVSVCVVTYNQKKYIRECLQSLVNQKTNFDYEVIVADDCSTDGTQEILQEFANKYPRTINPVFHKKNIGAARNFLTTHRMANGEYVAHMDGDDYALPGKLQAQVNVLDSKLECTAVWHKVDYFDDFGNFCSGKTSDLSYFKNGNVNFEQAIRMGFIGVHSSLMYRRASREVIELDQKVLDIYFTWDLLSKGTGYIVADVYGRYRVAALGSLTVSATREINRLLISHANHFVQKFPEQRKNFFIWAISMAIIHLKNMRFAALKFFHFALLNTSFASPVDIYSNLINIRNMQVRWRLLKNLKKQ